MAERDLLPDQEQLAESVEELYEQAPCGYFSTYPDGTFARVNRTFLNWMGYSREELVGRRRLQDLLTLSGKIFHETHIAPLLGIQGAVNEVAFDLVRKDGSPLPVLVNTVQKRDPLGHPLLNRTMVFNATDRRAYERELLLAQRRAEVAAEGKARLLAVISHEIRNPLSTITMLVSLLEHTNSDPGQEKHLRTLRSASQHLADLVNDLLDYSKIESGKMPLNRDVFSLRELVDGLADRWLPRAQAKLLSLRVEIDDRIPERLVGDRLKIGQVLANLLGNAIKFTERGSVCFRAEVIERESRTVTLKVSVEDTGIGIPEDRLADIFEEFAQASSDVTARFGGTGLGLTISRKLVQLFGSDISVASTPGVGSTFSFTLRLEEEDGGSSDRP